MKVRVLHPGFNSSFQDLGRMNGLAYGIPRSGAMDQNSLRFCNSLLGNSLNEACIEFAMMGPKLEFLNSIEIVITGANFNALVNGKKVPNNKKLQVLKGDVLSFKGGREGVFGYIGFKGKIDIPMSWGSKSTYSYVDLGEVNKSGLLKGSEISINKSQSIISSIPSPVISSKDSFGLYKGPEFDDFSEKSIDDFVKHTFTIGAQSNRMGYRLENESISSTETGNILSSGTIPGTIQVPKSGKPIVLMSDSPCTGGYPRIGVINKNDLNRFSQVPHGNEVNFVWLNN